MKSCWPGNGAPLSRPLGDRRWLEEMNSSGEMEVLLHVKASYKASDKAMSRFSDAFH